MRHHLIPVSIAALTIMLAIGAVAAGVTLDTELVVAGIDRPVLVTAPPGDPDRLFIVEEQGVVHLYDLTTQTLNPTPFLDISAIVDDTANQDTGIGGFVFDPNYATNGFLYVAYYRTAAPAASVVARYTRLDNETADPASAVTLLTVLQPNTGHDVSWLAFGPHDDYLYIASGDGASGNPVARATAQDVSGVLTGKILRIDPHGTNGPGGVYGIPPDNPFVDAPGEDEIWAYGVRSPVRCAFDAGTADLYIADVGQSAWEEITVLPAGGVGGENLGWSCREGANVFDALACTGQSFVEPIHEYSHAIGCAVIGGEVYRGCAIPELRGTYFFADFCSDRIWSFAYDSAGEAVTDFTERTAELQPVKGGLEYISSFGTDALGELYICLRGDNGNVTDTKGAVYRVVAAAVPAGVSSPTAPTDLTASAVSEERIDLSWTAAVDPLSEIASYRVFRNGRFLQGVLGAETSFSDTGLDELTAYTYTVSAVNCPGVEGPPSAPAVETTLPDLAPPVVLDARADLSPPRITITFSEALAPGPAETAANYAASSGVTIDAAVLDADATTVTLDTSPLAVNERYTIAIDGLTDASVTGNSIAPGTRIAVWVRRIAQDLVVLYELEEGTGTVVADGADGAAPLDLQIDDGASTTWFDGGLSVTSPTAVVATASSAKVHGACTASDAISIEAWVRPASMTQTGPARIVTFSNGASNRNFTLGQQGDAYDCRLRTTETNSNGVPSLLTPAGDLTTNRAHVVYTRDAGGAARIYVDGAERATLTLPGDLSAWDPSYTLALANEPSLDRPWLGDLSLVAVYSRALAPEEIAQHFALGPDPAPPPCAADLTGPVAGEADGNVDALDFLRLVSQWGTPCPAPCDADITGSIALVPDGNVDGLDFLLLIAQWGSPAACSD